MAPPYSLGRLLGALEVGFGSYKKYSLVRDAIDSASSLEHTILLRFDVERDLQHHLSVAGLLREMAVPSTMYFHTRSACYDAPVMHEIEALGHEVGYHHECLDRCRGDYDQARDLFLREVDLFRKDGFELTTVCGHGEAGLSKAGYRSNEDLFERFPDLLTQCGLKGEVYHFVRDKAPLYASDTFRNYRGFWDTLLGAPSHSGPVMILAHLHRWRQNPVASLLEIGRDLGQQLSNRLRGSRKYSLAGSRNLGRSMA